MPSLSCPGLPRRVLVTALVLVFGPGLEPFGLPWAAHAKETAGDVRESDATPFAAARALDDRFLACQRGGRAGMTTVTGVPGMTPGVHSVTLWDELARPAPAPLPIPVDTTGVVQSNVINYTRN